MINYFIRYQSTIVKSFLIPLSFIVGINSSAHARYYEPTMGRFISPDTIVPNANDPQSLNRYSYVRNNPLNLVDPSGHFFWVPVIVGAAMGAYSAGRATNWDQEYMLRGAVVGAVGGAVGAGVGNLAMNITRTALLSGAIGGAAGGTASGYAGAAMFGGNRGTAMEQGALWGGIGGGLSQGMTMANIPDAFAQAGSGYLAGHWQGGKRAAESGAAYGFTGSIMSAVLVMNGVDADGVVPQKNSTESEMRINSTQESFVVTPELSLRDSAGNSNLKWLLIGLFSGGYEHSWHSSDSRHYPEAENPGKARYYRRVERQVDFPGEAYLGPQSYNIFNNNCTTRFGYSTPNAYYSNFHYVGPSSYWRR